MGFNSQALNLMIQTKFKVKSDEASNGLEAVKMFKENLESSPGLCERTNCPNSSYKLIFMDLNMPVMDGFESTEKILEFQSQFWEDHPSFSKPCTIIALTAFTNNGNVHRCKQIGMADVLNKPAIGAKIYSAIQTYCQTEFFN